MRKDVETTIEYKAKDSLTLDAENRRAFLYRDSEVTYGNKNIKAHTLNMDYNQSIIDAKLGTNSTGKEFGIPVFKEGKDIYEAKQIRYNYKSRKGQVKEIITKQGDALVHGSNVRKEPNNNMFVQGAEYTTCDLGHPHYSIKATKIKVIPGKKIITGAFNLQIDDIPSPIAFPFGIFPMPKKRGTGIIMPTYADTQQRGLGLVGGGFFWAVSPYIGIKTIIDLYTLGGQGYTTTIDYKSRYSFSGGFNLNINNLIINPDDPLTASRSRTGWIRWNHITLSKGTGRFSAAVNAGSQTYNRDREFNVNNRQTANFTSNISYSNVIKKTPFSYAAALRQDQNIANGTMNFDLPSLNINMSRVSPFKNTSLFYKIEPIKKFGFSYSGNFVNRLSNILSNSKPTYTLYPFSNYKPGNLPLESNYPDRASYEAALASRFTDSIAYSNYFRNDTLKSLNDFTSNFAKASKTNITHAIPFSTSIKILRYFSLNPSINYNEWWYRQQFNHTWDSERQAVKIDTLNQFSRAYQWNTGANLTTRIYGTFYVKNKTIEAIRHTIVPTIGLVYTPDFSNQTLQKNIQFRPDDGSGKPTTQNFNRFGTGSAGPTTSKSANINFGFDNIVEMKIKDKKDTVKKTFKKVKLLDNLNIRSSYNLLADSFALQNFSLTARTRLFDLFDINYGSNFDPYYYQDITTPGQRTTYRRRKYYAADVPNIYSDNKNQNGYTGIGRFVNMNLTIGTQFKSKKGKRKIPTYYDGTDVQFYGNMIPDYIDWDIPWNLRLNYTLTYNRFTNTSQGFLDKTDFRNNITFNGDFSFTTKWRVAFVSGFDVRSQNFSNTVFTISRDLHCWVASMVWQAYPAQFQYFLATIGIKTPSLKDVKLDRRGAPFRD